MQPTLMLEALAGSPHLAVSKAALETCRVSLFGSTERVWLACPLPAVLQRRVPHKTISRERSLPSQPATHVMFAISKSGDWRLKVVVSGPSQTVPRACVWGISCGLDRGAEVRPLDSARQAQIPECGVHSQQPLTSLPSIGPVPVGTCDQERHRMRLNQPFLLSRAFVSETVR
jgi:hypothetical protein